MIFTHPQAAITFRHGPRPSGGVRSYDCKIVQSSAGMVISNTYRGAFTVWTVSWANMPATDKADLESFFIHTRGMSDQFTWTLSDGTTKTVRFKNSVLAFTEKPGGVYDISIELME